MKLIVSILLLKVVSFSFGFTTTNPTIRMTRIQPSTSTSTSNTTPFQLFMIGDLFNFDKKKQNQNQVEGKEEEEEEEEDRQSTRSRSNVDDENDDPVEKLFKFFFGEKEEKPMGLARFGAERFPGMFTIFIYLYNGRFCFVFIMSFVDMIISILFCFLLLYVPSLYTYKKNNIQQQKMNGLHQLKQMIKK